MDKIMTEEQGGQVADFIKIWKGITIRCFGVCAKERIMTEFKGYEHDNGLKDSQGVRYWVYFECPKCKYGHSWAKMDFFLEHTEREREARGL